MYRGDYINYLIELNDEVTLILSKGRFTYNNNAYYRICLTVSGDLYQHEINSILKVLGSDWKQSNVDFHLEDRHYFFETKDIVATIRKFYLEKLVE